MNNPSIQHHYVPQWYQKRFLLERQTTYFYHDMHPNIMILPNGELKKDKADNQWGTKKCFVSDHLYTTSSFEKPDFLETYFFGKLDTLGSTAFPTIINNNLFEEKYFYNFINFMDAQKLRTPKGMQWLNVFLKTFNPKTMKLNDKSLKEEILKILMQIRGIHQTIWTECVWEIVSAKKSEIKFIVTDHPVAIYNPKIAPNDYKHYGTHNIKINLIGTRTVYPLDLNHCLILSNRQYLLEPYKNHIDTRINSRYFSPSIFNMLDIIRGRMLNSDEVTQINFILKSNAQRYIAAANPQWLELDKEKPYKIAWHKIDKILLPKENIKLRGTSFVGFGKDNIKGFDDYGRPLNQEMLEKIQQMITSIENHKKIREN